MIASGMLAAARPHTKVGPHLRMLLVSMPVVGWFLNSLSTVDLREAIKVVEEDGRVDRDELDGATSALGLLL